MFKRMNSLTVLPRTIFLPMITSPTRFAGRTATLIDNIFTNAPAQVTSAIILSADISDHLPVLIHLDLAPLKTGPTTYFSRNINDSMQYGTL